MLVVPPDPHIPSPHIPHLCWWYRPMLMWVWRLTTPDVGERSPVISLRSVDLPTVQGKEERVVTKVLFLRWKLTLKPCHLHACIPFLVLTRQLTHPHLHTCSVGSNEGNPRVTVHTQLQVAVQAVLVLTGVRKADLAGQKEVGGQSWVWN